MPAFDMRGWSVCLLIALLTSGCGRTPGSAHGEVSPAEPRPTAGPSTTGSGSSRLNIEIVAEYPHDPSAFTQGLEVLAGHPNHVLESTGGYGSSSLRVTDLRSGKVTRKAVVPELYAMGAAAVPDIGIWQLTWQDEVAILRDATTLAELRRVHVAGEGWGLCFDGTRLVQSDGTDRLTFRDPQTFERLGEVAVSRNGAPVTRINELDCSGGTVWANVWRKHFVLRIDPVSGDVLAEVDISRVVRVENSANGPEAVPNGIAAVGSDELLLTGKLYRHMFRVRVVAG